MFRQYKNQLLQKDLSAMRNNPKSIIMTYGHFPKILIYFFLLLGIINCNCNKGEKKKLDSRWSSYVKEFTAGQVSKEAKVRVVFLQDMVEQTDIGNDASKLIDISPNITGKAVWSARNELTFTPEKDLPMGQEYEVELDLKEKLKELPKDLHDFVFYFEVMQQDFEIHKDGLHTPDLSNLSQQEFKGRLVTADVAKAGNVEKIITVSQAGKTLPIQWSHGKDRWTHKFVVANVIRKKEAESLEISYNGRSIQSKRKGEEKYSIPARGEFKIVEVKTHLVKGQSVTVYFSDPLLEKQNLKGLVRIQGKRTNLSVKGNVVTIYSRKTIVGKVKLIVDEGVRNSEKKRLGKTYSKVLNFESLKPGVRFVDKGTVLPENKKLTVAFEAVHIHSLQVTAFKIPSNNIAQFLQVNNFSGDTQMKRVGRYIWRKTVHLTPKKQGIPTWTRFHLDVTDLFKKHPGSLFQLTLSINRGNSSYTCPKDDTSHQKESPFANDEEWNPVEQSGWDGDYYSYGSEGENSDWSARRDPCANAYYNAIWNHTVQSRKNVIASNLGLLAKMGESGTIYVATTDLRTAKPLDTEITVFNFQNQKMAAFQTGSSGLVEKKLAGKPFYLRARNGSDTGYLKLDGRSMLPLSHFDTGGRKLKEGTKGYIFGERGVWRPGDTMFLSFVLEDKNKLLPKNHPLHMELYDPQGRLIQTIRKYRRSGNYYLFQTATGKDAPTGNWKARVHLGGRVFDKMLRVETVVPNRLKINLEFPDKVLYYVANAPIVTLRSQWLHGAKASNRKAEVSVEFKSLTTKFTSFQGFEFDDVTRSFSAASNKFWFGKLNEEGEAQFPLELNVPNNPSGTLKATFTSKVFEKAGQFSTESFQIPYHFYNNYVGIKIPKGDATRNMLLTDKFHKVQITSVSAKGKKVSGRKVVLRLYKMSWRYWWDKAKENLANFESSKNITPIAKGDVTTRNGMASWKFKIKYPEWGRYLLRACDVEEKHCSSKIIYIDWPGWAGRSRAGKDGAGASSLSFTSSKSSYKVGESATIFLPGVAKGRALISLENGSRVLSQRWEDTKKGKNKFTIKITQEMNPNVYVHVTLIQPHLGRINDRPLRLYGVIPLLVNTEKTKLTPILKAPQELRPMQAALYTIREKKGRAMNYSLAIVDEGLLGLTRYQTPDLRTYFNAREALGVRTWDLYDDVAGAYGTALRRVLSLGGGMEMEKLDNLPNRRFPPVVKFLGPFGLKAGTSKTHKVVLPNYIGAVRVMVVATSPGAYGFAEKSVPVRQKLMIQPTLPRVLGPGEKLLLPVSVIVTSPKIRKVKLSVKTDEFLQLQEKPTKIVSLQKAGEKMVYFSAITSNSIGSSKVSFQASGGGYTSKQDIHIPLRAANPPTTRSTAAILKPGKSWEKVLIPHGIRNTNSATLEVSTIPPINLGRRLKYLIHYPHGCVEQTVSAAFPQLYLEKLIELKQDERNSIERYVKAAIRKLTGLQASSGGFQYWPSSYAADDWSTSYAGHFLVEAKKKGFYVPESLLQAWKSYQYSTASNWQANTKYGGAMQAYRLFTLALAQKSNIGAMNRLRERVNDMQVSARWHLAAAFQLAGQKQAARKLIEGVAISSKATYLQVNLTYGSNTRDDAIILQALTALKEERRAKELAVKLSKAMAGERWYSTQTTAYTLLSLAKFVEMFESADGLKVKLKIAGSNQTITSSKPVYRKEIKNLSLQGLKLYLQNPNDKGSLFINLTSRGVPAPGKEMEKSNGLLLDVVYKDRKGKPFSPTQLKHGQDLFVELAIRNTSNSAYKNLALSHILPSGWQIHNQRLAGGRGPAGVDYQDIRDDRVLSYFDLAPGAIQRIKIHTNASFKGRYYLPAIQVEAMYDASIHSVRKGRWIEIK
ncbi:MAG: MG2 domain-containing protein [Spirochaetota bacterium]